MEQVQRSREVLQSWEEKAFYYAAKNPPKGVYRQMENKHEKFNRICSEFGYACIAGAIALFLFGLAFKMIA